MANKDTEENNDTTASEGFVLDEETNDVDLVAGDGQVIRHRMVYVRDHFRPTVEDQRIHALQQANATHAQRYYSKDEEGPERESVVLETATKYLEFLQGGPA